MTDRAEIALGHKLMIGDDLVKTVNSFSYLGVILDKNLTMKPHLANVKKNSLYRFYNMHQLRDLMDNETALCLYKTCILPTLEYTAELWLIMVPLLTSRGSRLCGTKTSERPLVLEIPEPFMRLISMNNIILISYLIEETFH